MAAVGAFWWSSAALLAESSRRSVAIVHVDTAGVERDVSLRELEPPGPNQVALLLTKQGVHPRWLGCRGAAEHAPNISSLIWPPAVWPPYFHFAWTSLPKPGDR